MSILTNRLSEALNDKGISKSELARRAGISRQVLNGYFSEKSRPSKEIISDLANVLGVNPAWLDEYDVPKYKQDNNEVEITDDNTVFTYEGRKIPKEDLEIIRRLMRGGKE